MVYLFKCIVCVQIYYLQRTFLSDFFFVCDNSYHIFTSLDYQEKWQEGWIFICPMSTINLFYSFRHSANSLGMSLWGGGSSDSPQSPSKWQPVNTLLAHVQVTLIGRCCFPSDQIHREWCPKAVQRHSYVLSASSELPQCSLGPLFNNPKLFPFHQWNLGSEKLLFFIFEPKEYKHSFPLGSSYWINKVPPALYNNLSS